MSQEEIFRFSDDLRADPELAENIEGHSGSIEMFAMAARANGYDITDEDLATYIEQNLMKPDVQLAEEELDLVTGGTDVFMFNTLKRLGLI